MDHNATRPQASARLAQERYCGARTGQAHADFAAFDSGPVHVPTRVGGSSGMVSYQLLIDALARE